MLFKTKNKKDQPPRGFYTLSVNDVQKNTDQAITIKFNIPEKYKKDFEYKPGQYLTISLNIEGKEYRRNYSLNSSPYLDELPSVTVKNVKDGIVSNYLNNNLKTGDKLYVMTPMGNFTYTPANKNKEHFLFAGGSGITPVIGIIKSILHNEDNPVTLVYCNRDEDNIIFEKEIEKLREQYKDQFRIIHRLSRPRSDSVSEKGRLDKESTIHYLKEYVNNIENTEIYLCGPQGMMSAAEEAINKEMPSISALNKESFVTEKSQIETGKEEQTAYNSDETESKGAAKVTVILDEEEHNLTVEDDTILETALNEGIDAPYSCESGICSTCMAKLLEGEVDMDDAMAISDEEIDEGFILACQSHPKTKYVKITWDH
ncbi:MAG: 2Fe-2S iron-sulfur cluster-binding protein [Flavobacteriales bacterium]